MQTGRAAGMSAADWAKQLQNNEVNAQRRNQAKEQAVKLGNNYYSWQGVDGSSGFGLTSQSTSPNYNQFSGGGTSSVPSNGAFGSLFSESFDRAFNAAKDLSTYNLGLTKDLGRFNFGLRNDEFNENFRRQSSLERQQQGATQTLEDTRQSAETGRLEKQLNTQRQMQDKDLGFQRDRRSVETALALRGLK